MHTSAAVILILVYGSGSGALDGPYSNQVVCVQAGRAYMAQRHEFADDRVVAFACGDPDELIKRSPK